MARVYLETSFVSACVTDREDAASVYRRETSLEWWEKQGPRHELVVSTEVLAELENPGFRQREAAIVMIEPLSLLAADADALGLAQVLVRERVMPGPIDRGDSMHVAIATVHSVDFIELERTTPCQLEEACPPPESHHATGPGSADDRHP